MKRILAIDDDLFAREFYRYLLEAEGWVVETAPTGEEGLARFREGGFDLVILGLFVHGLDGPGLVRELDPEVSGIPLVAIFDTDVPGAADPIHLALTLGADRAFPKSFDYRDLVEAVRELLAGAEAAA